MIEDALLFIEEHGEVLEREANYLRTVNWADISLRKFRKDEHTLHIKILKGFCTKMQDVIKESDGNLKNEEIKKFNSTLVEELDNYIERAHTYFETERWQDYGVSEDSEAAINRGDEMDFQEDILKNVIFFKKEKNKLNVQQKIKKVVLPIHSDKIISIPMARMMEENFPEILEFINRDECK
jgi:hypothetical protein